MTGLSCNRLLLIVILLCATISAAGQTKRGEIRIEVKDPSGKAMQAEGKLEGLGTGVTRTFQTDDQGTYTFGMLPYGRYRLEVSRDAFATQSTLIDVQSDTPTSRTLTMAIGAAAYKVDVISATPLQGVDLLLKDVARSEEHTSELQSLRHLVCRLLLE